MTSWASPPVWPRPPAVFHLQTVSHEQRPPGFHTWPARILCSRRWPLSIWESCAWFYHMEPSGCSTVPLCSWKEVGQHTAIYLTCQGTDSPLCCARTHCPGARATRPGCAGVSGTVWHRDGAARPYGQAQHGWCRHRAVQDECPKI